MANQHAHKQRCLRQIPQEPWDTFAVNAGRVGSDRSAVVYAFIRWFNGEPEAELPTRPPPGHDARSDTPKSDNT